MNEGGFNGMKRLHNYCQKWLKKKKKKVFLEVICNKREKQKNVSERKLIVSLNECIFPHSTFSLSQQERQNIFVSKSLHPFSVRHV